MIHNIIQEDLIKQKYNVEIDETRSTFFKQEALTFISVGRLVDQKGYDRLLEIHHRLIQEGLLHHIMIIGGGEDEAVLKQKIHFHILNLPIVSYCHHVMKDCQPLYLNLYFV